MKQYSVGRSWFQNCRRCRFFLGRKSSNCIGQPVNWRVLMSRCSFMILISYRLNGDSWKLSDLGMRLRGLTLSWKLPREEFQHSLWGVFSCQHVINLCLPDNVSFVDQQLTSLYGSIISSILFKTLCELILLEVVIWRPLKFLGKFLWSGSNTTLPYPWHEDALTELIDSSILGITVFSNPVKTASCTLFSPVVITLSTSLCTILTMFFSSLCIFTCRLLTWVRSLVSFRKVFVFAMLVRHSVWVSWLLCPIIKLVSASPNSLRSLLFCCFFFFEWKPC